MQLTKLTKQYKKNPVGVVSASSAKYKFIKLNKFDKNHDITWESLNGFSTPQSRLSVIMTHGERTEFIGLVKELEKKWSYLRVSGGTEANIFIVERAD